MKQKRNATVVAALQPPRWMAGDSDTVGAGGEKPSRVGGASVLTGISGWEVARNSTSGDATRLAMQRNCRGRAFGRIAFRDDAEGDLRGSRSRVGVPRLNLEWKRQP